MTDRDYFDLKSYSYYDPQLTWADFRAAVDAVPQADLPFVLTDSEEPIGHSSVGLADEQRSRR